MVEAGGRAVFECIGGGSRVRCMVCGATGYPAWGSPRWWGLSHRAHIACPDCGLRFTPGAGLAAHRRKAHHKRGTGIGTPSLPDTRSEAALHVVGDTSAERLLRSMRGHGLLDLLHSHDDDADDVPTVRQVAVVVRAFADYTHCQHMTGDTVRVLGEGGAWSDRDDQAHVLGRYFHAVADQLRDMAREAEAANTRSRS